MCPLMHCSIPKLLNSMSSNSLTERFNGIKKENLVFLSLVVFFIFIIIILFYFMVEFFSKNINKVFSSEAPDAVSSLNLEQYALVAKKLHFVVASSTDVNISTSTQTSSDTKGKVVEILPFIATTSQASSTDADKKALILEIRNSTKVKGLASALAITLDEEGFVTTKTGNEDTQYEVTTILLSSKKKDYSDALLTSIRKAYPDATLKLFSETQVYDALVIIGGK